MKKVAVLVLALLFSLFSSAVCVAQSVDGPHSFDAYVGLYRSTPDDCVSIAKFDLGDGQNRLLLTDFMSGVIRILSPISKDSFSAGTGLLVNPPVEMGITFIRNERNDVTSLLWQRNGSARRVATKVKLRREEVSFHNGDVTLSGTLIMPMTRAAHPAVVFLHGSGTLNRYSFGPFPDFLLSQGFAVLIYDKRGTGGSNGNLEKSTFDDLAADGRAAIQILKSHEGINPHRIGLCGTSQGGFLAALVASGNRDVAFIINLYGMYVPVWQQELYSAEAEMREGGLSQSERAEALAFMKLEFDVGRTGHGWERLAALRQQAKSQKWFDNVPHFFSDLNELRYYWRTLYSYNPALALEKVTCPILALFGELDNSTPVPPTIANMQRALRFAGNRNFTYKVFPRGNHGLLESETGSHGEIPRLKRFVPKLFNTMTLWLKKRA